MLEAQESGKKMWENTQKKRCMKISSQNPEGEIVHVGDIIDYVHIIDDAGGDSAVNGQERRFVDIDFQYVPETAESVSVEGKAPKVAKGCDSNTGEFGDSVRRRSPRPVQKRVKPKRYQD
ncbi:uncharacterized protein AKAME5_001682300 [Lates japonicus]|uniref:Uncharacterized protein n=1 Tax=Lates japonicus TaxID=270547 RepID=A0AAD3N3Z0_LATJO|nr:uncharacterized protein AKAME5_001682300 [Lates japonicus]